MDHVEWMEDLESRYRKASGLKNRAQFKIFYSPVRAAKVLVLGINPGGDPRDIYPDGMRLRNDPAGRGAASAGYYENNEHDVLDCDWTENVIRDLLTEILHDNVAAIREDVVKTNLSFRRSPNTDSFKDFNNGMTLKQAYKEAAPFIREILGVVCPRLVLLEGSILDDFTRVAGASGGRLADKTIKTLHRGTETDLYRAEYLEIPNIGEVLVVKLAHPSYHGAKYAEQGIGRKIRSLLNS